MAPDAATWTLTVPGIQLKAESLTQLSPAHGEESIIGLDLREVVSSHDFQDGQKYRSIVKIQSQFRTPAGEEVWMMGSGWLISPDTVVTAGHVVYDQAYQYGPCTQIKCYIGYEGVDSVPKSGDSEPIPAVQPRYGYRVVTTASWIKDFDSRIRDVAFIRVHKPFVGNLNVFKAIDTEPSATLYLGVVGYPGDKEKKNEKGALMYAQFAQVAYNLETSPKHMISYPVSTFGGQSGAPVLAKTPDGIIAIGTHCYGAGGGNPNNSGNPIGGKWGNNYTAFLSLFSKSNVFSGEVNNVNFVSTDGSEPPAPPPGPVPKPPFIHPSQDHGIVEEGFLDVLKSVAKIGSSVISVGAPLLGPIGAVVGPVAGGLLGAIAGQEATLDALKKGSGDPIAPGVVERAVLAEASLQAVLSLCDNHQNPDDPTVNSILSRMSNDYMSHAPNVDLIASKFAPQLTECALDVASFRLGRALLTPPQKQESTLALPRKQLVGLPESTIIGGNAFVEGLLGATAPVPGAEEGAFDFLGPVISKAVSVAKPLLSHAAKYAVTDIVPHLVKLATSPNTESIMAPTTPATQEQTRLLFKRALLADAALKALKDTDGAQLGQLKVTRKVIGTTETQEEGIFDFIKSTAQMIGPYALDAAKGTVKRLAPVLIDATASMLKEKLTGKVATANSLSVELGKPGLKKKTSNLDLYRAKVQAADEVIAPAAAWTEGSPQPLNPDQPLIISTPPHFDP